MQESESRTGRTARRLGGLTLAAALLLSAALEAQPRIALEAVECLPRGEFTQFLASIQPASTIRAAKLYFRSSLYPEFYFVAMSLDASGAFGAVLPLPAAETTKVLYYIEAVDLSFQTSRSDELEVLVSDDSGCRRGPGAMLFPGGSPAVVVGATQAGIPAIPAGFQTTGITGFLSTTGGLAATGGGGIGIGVGLGAAAGAAVGVGVLVAGGGEEDGASTSTMMNAPPLGGGNTTSTSPATSSVPGTTTSSGSSTTTTTSSSGSPATTTTPTTTVPPSTTTTTAAPALTACFGWQALGNCKVSFDSCSTPETFIQRYEWRMLGPPVPEPPQVGSFTFDFAADPRCRGTMSFNHPVRLTVFDSLGRSDSVQQNVSVRPGATFKAEEGAGAVLSFKSRLVALPADGSARGQIVVNGARLAPSDNSSASLHEVRVSAGVVRIEAALSTPVSPGSLWELDFSSSAGLVAGSLEVEGGAVVSADERRIVFRLRGDRGETFRLRVTIR